MKLLTLPLSVRRRLIQHEADVLTPAAAARTKNAEMPCSCCGGAMHLGIATQPFTANSVLPRNVAKCVDCGQEIDTQSGMIIKLGNPAKVEPALPLIDPAKE